MIDIMIDWVWNALIFILIGVGLLFSLSSKLMQFRYFPHAFKCLSSSDKEGIKSWQALMLSVGGRVGSGNIIGVGVALSLGGPGAIFWMWVLGFIGMATSIWECSLAQLFKQTEGQGFRGGPAFYIKYGLGKNWLWLAGIFSVLLFITFGFAFNGLQSYSVASSLNQAFGIDTTISGIILAIVVGLVIFGGINRLVQASSIIVPVMACGYLITALFVLITNIELVPSAIVSIIENALGIKETIAGGVGSAIIYGAKRGLFSNEAGLGSAPNVAATAVTNHPVSQGLVQGLSVFIDTIVLCTCTAVMILLSDVYLNSQGSLEGVTLTQQAMASHMGVYAQGFVSITLLLFGFTTMLYNYYLGENALDFFWDNNKLVILAYRLFTMVLVIWGTSQNLGTVLGFADLSMGLLALVNLFTLILLFKPGLRLIQDYKTKLKSGEKHPAFTHNDFPELKLDKNAWPKKNKQDTHT